VAALLAAGCGGGDGSGPEETVRDYFEAIRQMDGEAACAELTDELRQEIEQTPAAASTGRSCGDLMELALALNPALTQEDVDDLEIDVSEDGDQAEATFVNPLVEREETIDLVEQDGEWKIATLETRPGG
jgi:ketosteroid isomerase-like protein